MKDVVKFLFIIDVSGSMYGQKIAAVNAALTECLAELRQIGCLNDYDIQVSIATFAEKNAASHIKSESGQCDCALF